MDAFPSRAAWLFDELTANHDWFLGDPDYPCVLDDCLLHGPNCSVYEGTQNAQSARDSAKRLLLSHAMVLGGRREDEDETHV